jgi:valyl-tRNA synthetase
LKGTANAQPKLAVYVSISPDVDSHRHQGTFLSKINISVIILLMIDEKLLKPYDPTTTEKRIYEMWEDSGFFNPDVCIEKGIIASDAKPYVITLPPPNVTGILHMGHAFMLTLEDTLIRYHRMKGFRTLWLPGTDHAAIATQSRVEKNISKEEGKSRYDLGREELLRRVNEFAQNSHDTILSQMKIFGSSCDWSREAFTLDEKRNFAVRTAFKSMYDAGLITRGHRVVNWDPKGQTTISDDEIIYEERKANFYTFKYSKDFPITISTTRPETKVGDTAVAVHPEDPRYTEFVGKEYDVVFCGVPIHIKIIADNSVEKDFGTGALGVTPAHSKIDWEIAKRHNLPYIQVIDEKSRMIVGDERILGKKVLEAREEIVRWLREENLMISEEEVSQNVSTAERTGGIIEPLPKLQWFIAVNKEFTIPYSEINGIESGSTITLKEIMRKAVEGGQIEILPDYFSKTYFHWIDKLDDWCISRQIWYGHRIPVWYRNKFKIKNEKSKIENTDSNTETYCGMEAPEGEGWAQDEDTLDTWFSSGLWTFSTLGWPQSMNTLTGKPEKGSDLDIYHPTDVLETGYEILFFWVARMILMTGFHIGTIPFKKVYLHGTVRDAKGRKMSKSLNNGIDPIDVADKFGADAGRMALMVGSAPGIDTKISEDKIKGYKHFANKVWNISRFVLQNTEDFTYDENFKNWTEGDIKLIEIQNTEIENLTQELDNLKIHIASDRVYQYIWNDFAAKIIEDSKPILKDGTIDEKNSRAQFLLHSLRKILIVLHPFMPFVTEELWSLMPFSKNKILMVEKWPII